ncbi:MAG: copper transporter [Peptostreptococcaceae bacterium]
MHINMKYYIVSIGSIFISLGIGMLVGFNLNYDEELSKQQEIIISDLNVRFEELKENNNMLDEELEESKANYDNGLSFIENNSEFLIKDRLIDKNIGLFSTNQENKYNQELRNIIEISGANLAFDITIMNNSFNKDKIAEISDILELEFTSSEDIIDYVIESLSNSIEELYRLQELELITIDFLGENYNEYESVILAGGNNGELKEELFNNIDKPLTDTLKNNGKHIIGVQRDDSKFSYINHYFENKISTVDNINTSIGKLSLVMLLEDINILGKYGESEESDKLIPFEK